MNADYYDELAASPDSAVRVGWRHRIEQAYRFELALELLGATSGAVMDLGCGEGALAEYLRANGLVREWIGVEAHPRLAAAARRYGRVWEGRFQELNLPSLDVGCVVALGTIAAGADARAMLPELLGFAAATSPALCMTVLDAAGIAARPTVQLEHGVSAVSATDLRSSGRLRFDAVSVHSVSTTDLALVAGVPEAIIRTNAERFEATVAGPWGRGEPPERKAWLAAEVGLLGHAASWLSDASRASPLAKLVRERLSSAESSAK